jgi:hypothetical protein
LAVAVSGCDKFKKKGSADPAKSRIEAKRQQAACASRAAYDHVKDVIFDEAIRARNGDRAKLDMLADYSQVRMEQPMVESRDTVLDLTRCKGNFVLEIPPGAERGLGGQRRLEAEINYSAQAAADGTGLVYKVDGAGPIVETLAAFTLSGLAYRPPPAMDSPSAGAEPGPSKTIAQAELSPEHSVTQHPRTAVEAGSAPPPPQRVSLPQRVPGPRTAPLPPQARAQAEVRRASPVPTGPGSGESTVRAFYSALGQGNGAAASAQIIPEKRTSHAYSPGAISEFYGRMREPMRLTGIAPLSNGAYRVSYRYSAGRSHCNGAAVVRLTNRGGRNLISSIRALSGC